ncbi:serine/threonine-protein kinase [Actinosynnema sp. NPDC023658]|uniref:serine/threonine-protein kinase n=1 Tax=Actinosynnema sp. NPDC023658 TaxID=3155465 RepID=UPI0033D080F0
MADEMFGPYRIGPLLGRGGMGEVHRAHDTAHDRDVALKRLPPAFHDDAAFRARFRREARIAARLREPHVIPIHAYGEIDGRLYLDMRLVEGTDLGDVIARGPLEVDRAVRIVEQVASALDAAHADGLVHRDVKPSNVLLTPGDFVYLVDFGIARSTSPTATHITATDQVVGTLDYMAPERFGTAPVDARADTYALACVLYTCLTGRRPFEAVNVAALIRAHLDAPPPRAAALNSAVPAALDDVIARGMAKDPAARHESASALAAAARAATPPTPPAKPAPAVTDRLAPDVDQTAAVPRLPGVPPPDRTTPLVPGARPPDAPGNRRLVLAALATAAVLVAGYLVFNGIPGRSGTASSTTASADPTTEPTTSTSTTSGPNPEEQSLFGSMPAVYRTGGTCVTEPPDAEGVLAKFACTGNSAWSPRWTPPARAEFRLFTSPDAQEKHFRALVGSRNIPRDDDGLGCGPDGTPEHYSPYLRDADNQLAGDLITCYLDGGTGVLWWTDVLTRTTGTLVTAPDATGATLDSLRSWWAANILNGK